MFDLTFFEEDDETPFFGDGDGNGGVVVADFSTDPAHPRPYLGEVRNWSASEIDFPSGSSTLGGLTLEVLDKRTEPSDQRTGILTSRMKDVVGKRCLLRRHHPTLGWVVAFNGTVQSVELEDYVKYVVQLRDIRERERRAPLFFSNLALFGKDGKQGPVIDYGMPGTFGPPLVPAVAPFPSIASGVIDHFLRIPVGSSIVAGVALGPRGDNEDPFGLGDLGYPTAKSDGLFYFQDFQIRWRSKGSDDPWTYLRNMPATEYRRAFAKANEAPAAPIGASVTFYSGPTLYFASFDEHDIPESGQEIEFQVLALDVSPDTPFFWDGGTFGDLLKEIYDGLHSAYPPLIQYDADAMEAFRASTPRTRFIVREPVDNMREWVENNIYAPLGYAPAFSLEKKVAPVSWAQPNNATPVPRISRGAIIPDSVWEHAGAGVLNTVEYTYIRETLAPLRQIQKKVGRFIWKQELWIDDPTDDRAPWQRIVETKVTAIYVDAPSVATFGPKKISYEPITVRTIAGVEGYMDGEGAQDESGALLAAKVGDLVLRRFARGAPKITVRLRGSDPVVQGLKEGDWVRIDMLGLPDYATGTRG